MQFKLSYLTIMLLHALPSFEVFTSNLLPIASPRQPKPNQLMIEILDRISSKLSCLDSSFYPTIINSHSGVAFSVISRNCILILDGLETLLQLTWPNQICYHYRSEIAFFATSFMSEKLNNMPIFSQLNSSQGKVEHSSTKY